MDDLVKGCIHKFTLDTLANVAASLGYCIKLKLTKAA